MPRLKTELKTERRIAIAFRMGVYRFSRRIQGSLFLDYREASISGGESIREATAALSRSLDEQRLTPAGSKGAMTAYESDAPQASKR